MARISDLDAMYDRVEPAMFQSDQTRPTVYFVEGFGRASYVAENDTATIQALLDSRVQQLAQLDVGELRSIAVDLDVEGRSTLKKDELVIAIFQTEQAADLPAR